ncbi:MAG: DNA translocase FtsK [Paludibacteraceae bacterium]|nr:DNA translocase FtsK [Paludibacteraceae bacterium]
MPRRPSIHSTQSSEQAKQDIRVEKGSKQNFFREFWTFMHTPQAQLVCGVLLCGMALFALLSYISYFFTGSQDFDIIFTSAADAASGKEIGNRLGMPGARLAHWMIDGSFGVMSATFIVMAVLYGLCLFHVGQIRPLKVLFISAFWLIWGSITAAFLQILTGINTFFRWGGAHGEWIASAMNDYMHATGTILVLVVALVIFLIVTDRHFLPHMQRCWQWLISLFAKKTVTEEETATDISTEVTTPENTDTSNTIDLSVSQTEPIKVTGEPAPEITVEVEPPTTEEITEEPPLINIVEQPESPDQPADEETETDTPTDEDAELDINDPKIEELLLKDPEYLLKKMGPYDPKKDLEYYKFPSLDLLKVYDNETAPVINQEEQQNNANRIVTTLRNYGIEIEKIHATVGPTVTLYEIVPKAGTRIAKIQSLENDIMMSLSAVGIRIIAPMPGKGTVGIEVPNEKPQTVSMHSVIASKRFQEEQKMKLPVAIGRTITNEVFMFDLAKTPHLLVAGATGQGKSVAINAIITSLLYKKHPSELKFVLVDPKKVEFAPYRALMRHYLAAMPGVEDKEIIITDCQKVIDTLNSLVIEMENRYELLEDAGVRNLEDYNEKFVNRRLNPSKLIAGSLHHQFLPYIVIIIDEYGDFIMQAGKQVETPIARITQKARAVGMHMILATQRPSVNIVTGVIKANIPTRIALRTQSVVDSRTVLDAKGADQLVGKGDMLHSGNGNTTRIQCAFVDTPEVDRIVDHIQGQQRYSQPYPLPEYVSPDEEGGDTLAPGSVDMKRLDSMFRDVATYVVTKQEGSTSRLQRAFEIGYNRAGKLSDQLEAAGIVGPNKGPKGRDVLIQDLDTLEQKLQELGV